ncbi:MAG: hypothetical protein RL033_283 [Pseudomonadota bacterium]|jgi:large subunit ribosomal protein L33
MSRLVEQLESMFLTTSEPPAEGGIGGRQPRRNGAAPLPRRRIVLSCAQCGGRNYKTTKARREGVSLLNLSKFCSVCNAHTPHREAV